MYRTGFILLLLLTGMITEAASRTKPFLCADTAYLSGNIKNYPGGNSVIYLDHAIQDEGFPVVVNIDASGRFQVDLPLYHPIRNAIVCQERQIPFYISPGDSLNLDIQWTDREEQPLEITYSGTQARLNRELWQAGILGLKNIPYPEEEKDDSIRSCYALQINDAYRDYTTRLKQLSQHLHFSTEAQELLKNEALLVLAEKLLQFDQETYDMSAAIPTDPAIDPYYRLLKEIPWNNMTLLSNYQFSSFIKLFDYSVLLYRKWRLINGPQTFFITMEKAGYEPDDKAKELKMYFRQNPANPDTLKLNEFQLLQDKYSDSVRMQTAEKLVIKDILFRKDMQLKSGFIWEIMDLRLLVSGFKYMAGRSDALKQKELIVKELKNPFLISEAIRLTELAFPENPGRIFILPEGPAADVFSRITGQHKGKVLVIDIWATWCPPCLEGIAQMEPVRKKYTGKDVCFIYVSSEKNSPVTAFNRVMEKVDGYKYRLSEDDYNYLCMAFTINTIPRYILVNASGQIINPDTYLTDIESALQKLLE